MSITPTDAEIIQEAIDSRLLDVHTALPGYIQSYDVNTQTADIELQVKRTLLDDNDQLVTEELPILPNVPIGFPRSSSFFISFPLAKGDFVLVIFAEQSLDIWRSKGSVSPPGDARRHSLSGGVAIPLLYPNLSVLLDASSSNMVLGKDNTNAQLIVTSTSEIHLGKSASAEAARKGDKTKADTTMNTWISALTTYINGIAPGTLTLPTDFGVIDEGSAIVKIRD